ncbi:NEDD4 family-interacting protein 2-like [Lutra lutra]|uniref:NEDD4 family-interacting protein 2-like n=1 Tax=Lutra lutra TaxID=9657 RepID=UPI001FD536C1|nr:NEDD4 family-interacting protein 2-like [Lutra lutra]
MSPTPESNGTTKMSCSNQGLVLQRLSSVHATCTLLLGSGYFILQVSLRTSTLFSSLEHHLDLLLLKVVAFKAAAMAAAAAETAQRIQEEECQPRDDFSDADQLRVGNDGIFMLAFFMAFIFNWLGFCLSFCITSTIARRYGAISGFGLSLIKWILIVRFSDYFTGYFNGQYWLWWIFLVLGLLLFFRGFVNYLKVRHMSESMAAAHRTRYFFLL